MGHSGPCSDLIYQNDIVYEGWIDSRFTLMLKSILVITQGCIGNSKQILWIGLIG